MSDTDLQLLARYTRQHAEDAFAELVHRHLDLVFSAALRQVRSPQLAEEVAQSAFTDLARNAAKLTNATGDAPVLAAWLYQVTRRTAIDVVRRESRRQLREQIATEMNAMNAENELPHFAKCGIESTWPDIEPLLDEAMSALDDTDRAAVLLRYFENKSLREVGETLGASEDAARKRVSRAVERLREFFVKRGVTVGASGLVVVISANAVQAAPVGLAVTISTAAAMAGTTIATSVTATAVKTIAMTTLQKTIIGAALAAAVGTGIYEARQASTLRSQNELLQQQQAPLVNQLQQLRRERDDATNRQAALTDELARVKKNPSEVLKLRGEVGALRQEKATADSQSAISRLTANPETRKVLRERQKMAMSDTYSDLAKRLKLTPEQTGRFNDLLADQVMDSYDLITQALHDGKSQAEVRQMFSASDTAFQGKVQALLGDDALTQYQDYTKNLGSTLFVESFGSSLTGDSATVADKKNRLLQAMQEATQSALAAASLPANYQTLTLLNFGNFASEEEAAQSLQLKDNILGQVAARASAFLNADELNKLQESRTNAIKNSQNFILVNRKLMAPISQ